jgi:transmembrane sensor
MPASVSSSPVHLPTARWAVPRGLRVAGIAVVVIAVMFAILQWRAPESDSSRGRFVATAEEVRLVELGEGATMKMNAHTEVEVTSNAQSYHIALRTGEALFIVGPGSRRSVRVTSGSSVIRDVGTRFNVRRDSTATTVSVAQGMVLVTAQCEYSSPVIAFVHRNFDRLTGARTNPIRVESSEEATLSVNDCRRPATLRRLDKEQLASSIAWGDEWLQLSGVTVGSAIERFNRYNRRQLRVLDPSVAAIKVGGGFWASDVDVFLAVLERRFGVEHAAIDVSGTKTITLALPDCRGKVVHCGDSASH